MATEVAKKTNKTAKVKDSVTKSINKAGDYAKSNPKTVLYVVGGLAAIYLGYKIVKGFLPAKIDNSVSGTGGSTVGATLSSTEAANLAQQLLDAFNAKEPFWGTDEDTVIGVFKLIKNNADFWKISNAFGDKDYNGYNSPPEGAWSWLDSYEKRNLVYWLKSEIKPGDGEVYDIVKQRLTSLDIAF
ncbi:hypothetical protein [Mesoflavibacter sp. CH_XMU1404-2]|uniref:hypothetical protein n=1 Tax=Mesoflavibacter sp. CH_XMU1404-2 TaxID=3107766 RepID=UPI0030098DF9